MQVGKYNFMNRIKVLIFLLASFLIQACDKIEKVDTPVFDAYLEKENYLVGDTVDIKFKGDPGFITLYTGILGNDYGFKEGRDLEMSYLMNFDTQVLDGWQKDQLSILVSKNFDGDYTISGVNKATWFDITSKFRMLKPQETRVYTTSGLGDITSAIFEDKQHEEVDVYFAVKHVVKNQNLQSELDASKKNIASLNRVRGIAIQKVSPVSETILYNHASFGWKLFSTTNKETDRATLFPTYIELRGNRLAANLSAETEDWAVSGKMSFSRSVYAGPDWGKSIKSLNDKRLNNYKISYDKPGDYKITLVAFNSNSEGRREIIKQLQIKILPR